jgi:hypothetical protein
MAITSSFSNLATVTRASKKTDAGGWDFTSGGAVGTLTEYASGVAALHATEGALVEESSTNEIRNPRGEGATGSTAPTNWSLPASWGAIATWTYGDDDGWPYAQAVFSGTPSEDLVISFETTTAIAAATGDDWTISVGVRLASGSFSNIDDAAIRFTERTGAGVFVAQTAGSDFLSSINASQKRFFASETLSGGGTVAALQPQLVFGWTSGAVSLTLRFYAPQCEEKAYPTSPILPTAASPAASTRAADSVAVANGSWSNDGGAGTFYLSLTPNALFDTARLFEYGPGTNATRFNLNLASAGNIVAFYQGSAVSYVNSNIATGVSVGDNVRLAIGIDTDDFAASVNGETQFTDSSITIFSDAARAALGGWYSTGAGNCYIKDFRYFPRRLSNAELQAMVGN